MYRRKTPLHRHFQRYYDQKLNRQDSYYFETNSVAIRKTVFDKIGLFDPRYTSGGDNDFSVRAREQKLVYAKDAYVYHDCRSDLWSFFLMNYFNGKGRVTFLRKHGHAQIHIKEIFSPVHYMDIVHSLIRYCISSKRYLYKAVENLGYRSGIIAATIVIK